MRSKPPSPTTSPNSRRRKNRNGGQLARAYRSLLATLNPVYFARQFLKFNPDPAQERALLASVSNGRIALNCNRQWGKSTVAAILATHRLVTRPKSTVLVVAPSGRQSGETLRKVSAFLGGPSLGIRTRGDGINRASLVLPNGSRIVSLPAVDATVRGFSAVSLLIVDEASRVADAVYLALRPALATSRGDIVLVSTPHGRRGFFYREMTSSTNKEAWYRHTGPITECLARIPPEFVAEEQTRGESYFRQEYMCEFVETGKYVFDEQLLHQIVKKELEAFTWL